MLQALTVCLWPTTGSKRAPCGPLVLRQSYSKAVKVELKKCWQVLVSHSDDSRNPVTNKLKKTNSLDSGKLTPKNFKKRLTGRIKANPTQRNSVMSTTTTMFTTYDPHVVKLKKDKLITILISDEMRVVGWLNNASAGGMMSIKVLTALRMMYCHLTAV